MLELNSVRQRLERWKLLSEVVGLSSWIASFILWYHYALTRPAIRQPEGGRVYPLNTHGTVVYLTSREHFLLYSLIVVGVVCFLLTAGFYYYGKRQLPRP